MDQYFSFYSDLNPSKTSDQACTNNENPRLNSAERNQIELRFGSLDDLLPPEHKARFVWSFVNQLDLSNILSKIRVVEHGAGRPATDPKILLAIWLYATLDGNVSARAINAYCREHVAYQWLCGGVKMNYHTLSDFATKHGEEFNEFLIQSIAILMKQGFVNLEEVAQDGIKIRAHAGGSSFRRESTLQKYYEDAKQYLTKLRLELEQHPEKSRSRKETANLRAAKEREENVKKALDELKKFKEEKSKNAKKHRKKLKEKELQSMRASTTDPEARIMKMACNGFRPAYNVQFASASHGQVIIAVDVVNQGNDAGLITPMLSNIKENHNEIPKNHLVDGGYVDYKEINRAKELFSECTLFMPIRISPNSKKDPNVPQPGDSEAVAEWRKRMGTDEAKKIYKRRGSIAEFSNAQVRNMGLQQFLVRGLNKIKSVALRFALAHNMQRLFSLQGCN